MLHLLLSSMLLHWNFIICVRNAKSYKKSKCAKNEENLANYWIYEESLSAKLPICIRSTNYKWICTFHGVNFMRNKLHSAIKAKIQPEIKKIKIQSWRSKSTSVRPNCHILELVSWWNIVQTKIYLFLGTPLAWQNKFHVFMKTNGAV